MPRLLANPTHCEVALQAAHVTRGQTANILLRPYFRFLPWHFQHRQFLTVGASEQITLEVAAIDRVEENPDYGNSLRVAIDRCYS